MFHERTNHIDVKYHYVRDVVAQGKLKEKSKIAPDKMKFIEQKTGFKGTSKEKSFSIRFLGNSIHLKTQLRLNLFLRFNRTSIKEMSRKIWH